MNCKWTLALLLFIAEGAVARMRCPQNDDKCSCLSGPDFEFHCPEDYENVGGIVMHFSEKSIEIDCYPMYSDFFNTSLLPYINVSKIDSLRIRFCPLPPNGFREVLDNLGISSVKSVYFEHSGSEVTRIDGSYFEGLEMLKSLSLERNGRLELEEDVFSNTVDLVEVQLSNNKLTLISNLFNNTPALKSLDLSRNELTSLPPNLFHYTKNLVRLHLWQNNLTTLDEFLFEGLSKLNSLELSVNKIETISENAFRSLRNLTQLSLIKNNLSALPANLFQENTKLDKVLMRSNFNLKLPNYLFSNLSQLKFIDLGNCRLETIPENIFENSTSIKVIKLDSNNLKLISPTTFKGLEKLEELHLEHNKLASVTNVFGQLPKLQKLYLQNNAIARIEEDAFIDLTQLSEIGLQHNQIFYIHYRTFDNKNNLKIINLSHNQIDGQNSKIPYLGVLLGNNANLEDINLSHNRITDVGDVINLPNKIRLKKLDLRYNSITRILLSDLQTVTSEDKLIIRLDNNNITKVDLANMQYFDISEDTVDAHSNNKLPFSVIYLNNNPIECDCRNYDLLKYFRNEVNPVIITLFEIKTENLTCASPPELEDLPVATLSQSPKLMTCSLAKMKEDYLGCPEECSCEWRPFDTSIILNCSNRNLQTYPDFVLPHDLPSFDQVEMHLERNNLSMGPDGNLTCYNNVTKLFLSHNKIDAIKWVPPRLEVLRLDNNQIRHLDKQVLTRLNTSHLGNLTLDNNPWLCDCEAEDLKVFLRRHPRQVDASSIYCHESNNTLLIDQSLCQEWQVAILVVPVLALLLLVAVAAALYYRYQQELKIWLFAKNLCLWWVTEEDVDKDKTYDAFISYSHKDEDFVTQNLIPRLESGPNPYKLCLHYRNFVPGEFIAKQVTSSVIESRRTLVVLSPNFLESVWGKLEFRTAHAQAMAEGRVRVIIVLYGDIDINSLDDELKAYLRTNTYIKWGDAHFWDRLIYALPHSKRNASAHNQKHANVMNCIDDKFKLVAPVTASPGSTPPVLTLDPTLLKHPLTFVPSAERDTPPAEAGFLLTSTC